MVIIEHSQGVYNTYRTKYLIITHKSFEPEIKQLLSKYNINHDIWCLNIKSIFGACCSRLLIFNYPKINKYKKILYLDTDIIITSTLNYDEPMASDTNFNLAGADQKADDATIDGNFVFDELGLKSKSGDGRNEGLLLSHVVFHPVQKSANRKIQVLYTIKVRTNYTAS